MEAVNAWGLDSTIAFLNHGSFGAVPRAVIDAQASLIEQMEANPVRFIMFELPDLLAEARARAAGFVGADPDGFAFVPNATVGTNTLLRNLTIDPGDEILLTDHGYEACNLAAEFIAARRGAIVRFARLPIPADSPEEVRAAVLDAVTERTRYAVIDHITSPTAVVLPVAEIVADLAARGIETIVDGAHAPGQVDLDIESIGALGYTGNWHKWTCAPRGSGFLWARADWRESVRPLVISHGAGHRGVDGQRFRATFDWVGTADPTPYLAIPSALDVVAGMIDGGWDGVRARNHRVAVEWRNTLIERLGVVATAGLDLMGSMASIVVPPEWRSSPDPTVAAPALLSRLDRDHGVVVGIATQRETDNLFLRVSAHLHTPPEDIERLIGAVETF